MGAEVGAEVEAAIGGALGVVGADRTKRRRRDGEVRHQSLGTAVFVFETVGYLSDVIDEDGGT